MKVLFAEPDKMFRLAAAAFAPDRADAAFLREFFLTESDDPVSLLRGWAEGRPRPSGAEIAIAADGEDFARNLADAALVVLEKQPLDAALLERAGRLRRVQLFGRDAGAVDLDACARRGVAVRTLERHANRHVAEHTLLLMLALARDLDGARAGVRAPSPLRPSGWAYNWPPCRTVRGLAGRRIGLIGLGEVAQLVAEYLRPFGADVVYTRRHRDAALEERLGVRFVDLETLVATADVISVHVPGGPDSRHLLDAALLGRVNSGAVIVNTARGAVVDEAALVEGLEAGRIGGAGLDVFAVEPLAPDHPLQTMPNVILTPHVAAGSRDADWLEREIGPILDAAIAVEAEIGRS